jgi:hypothetical protein
MSKKYTTNFLEDTNGSTGTTNQVLVSTATGVDWVDGSGSGIIGGPYLPLSAGSSYPLTGTLYGTSTNFSGSGVYAGSMTLGSGASTAEAFLQIGVGRTGNGYSYIDLIGDATYTDYGLRIIRNNTGANTVSAIIHKGTGNFEISSVEASSTLFRTNNTTALTLTNTQNAIFTGNVGIGTTSPAAGLQVAKGGTTIPVAGSSTASAVFGNSTSDDNYGVAIGANSSGVGYISSQRTDGNATTYNLAIQPNGGNVGIGTTSPNTKLQVSALNSNYVNLTGGFSVVKAEEGYGLYMGVASTGNSWIQSATYNNGTTYPLILNGAGGNVGIGTSSPLHKLHVNGASDGNSIYTAMLQNTGTAAGTASKLLFVQGGSTIRGAVLGGLQESASGSPTSMVFETSAAYATPTERMRITSTGNVGIGVTGPTRKLTIGNANGFINNQISLLDGGGTEQATIAVETTVANDLLVASKANLRFFTGSAIGSTTTLPTNERMRITSAGGISFGSTGTAYGTSGQILKSNANASPTWVDASAVIGGPYLPLAGGLMTGTGNITMPDNFELRAGTDSDLLIYHNGTNNFILNTVGNLNIRNTADDGNITFQSDDGSGGYTSYFIIDGGSAQTQVYKDFRFQDDVKANFGTGSDLQIYHDGSDSYIDDTGTGWLRLRGNGGVILSSYSEGETMLQATRNGAVNLYYDNSKKFETTSAGVTVTGIVAATGGSSTEWNTAYDNRITSLTTTGTSGAATLISNVLNIPNYADGQGVTSIATTNGITGGPISSTGTLQVDSTVLRTSSDQSASGIKTFTTRVTGNVGTPLDTFMMPQNPEGKHVSAPWFFNDMAYARLKGATVSVVVNGGSAPSTASIDAMLDASTGFWNMPTAGVTSVVITMSSLPKNMTYGSYMGLTFGNTNWRAKNITLESYYNGQWNTLETYTNQTEEFVIKSYNSSGNAQTQLRYTLSNFNTTSMRIVSLFAYNYNATGMPGLYATLDGFSMYGEVDMNQNKIIDLPTPTATTDAANKAYVDDKTWDWNDITTGTPPTFNQSTTGSAATLTTARTLTIGATGKTFNGSANVSWTLAEIGAQASGNYITGTGSLSAQNLTDISNLSGTNTGDQTNIAGNAGTVTNGVYTVGNQTIGGAKTFSSAINAPGGNSTEWNTAYTDRNKWDGEATGLTASTGRASLGGTTVGENMFILTNPSAITFPRFNANNTVSALSASDFRTAIGAGTGGGDVSGSGASGRVTFWNGTTSVSSDADFKYDSINNVLSIGDPTPSAYAGISIARSSGASIRIKDTNTSGAYGVITYNDTDGVIIQSITGSSASAFKIRAGTNTALTQFQVIGTTGQIQFSNYGNGNITGDATKMLAVTTSGLIVEETLPTSSGGTVTSVTAGSGMTQTGTSTVNPTLNVIGGTGITANADDVAITYTGAGNAILAAVDGSGTTIFTGAKIWVSDDGTIAHANVSDLPFTNTAGTVTSVGGTGTVSGLTLTGTVTSSGNLTLGGTLALTSGNITTGLGFTPYNATNPAGYTANTGTVTSVAATSAGGISINGSPITTSGTLIITNTDRGSSQNIFKNIAVSGQTTLEADTNNDTLTLATQTGLKLLTTVGTDTITYSPQMTVMVTSHMDHSTNNSASWYYLPFVGEVESTGTSLASSFVTPFAGYIRSITYSGAGNGSATSATTIKYQILRNGSVVYGPTTALSIGSGTSSGKSLQTSLSSGNATFTAAQRISIQIQVPSPLHRAMFSIILQEN